jgi:hypothetical protein
MDTRQLTTSYNGGRGGRSRSYATRREPIFDVATLAALPRGRAVLMASGIDPVVIRTQSVLDGPHGAAVRDSLAKASMTVAHSVRHVPFVETSQSRELEKEPMNDYD